MALSKDGLLAKLGEWGVQHETVAHAASPTCEVHSKNLRGTALERFIGRGQAKNLFFKVPSGGGPLKNRMILVCALVETAVDNKLLSTRLGVKPSAPIRFAGADVFDNVLQIPQGSVNPFVMAQPSCSEVALLLDKSFLDCERLLFHPMQNDFTTALTPSQLTAFLEKASPAGFAYVDFGSKEPISLPSDAGGSAPAGAQGGSAPAKGAGSAAAPEVKLPPCGDSAGGGDSSARGGATGWFSQPWVHKDVLSGHQQWRNHYGL